MNLPKQTDILIIGGGVCGTSLFYVLKKYTSVQNITLIEKASTFGSVNSHVNNNSQTLHVGDIESHYSFEKAKQVKKATSYVISYLKKIKNTHIYTTGQKILLAVGDKEVAELEERYEKFRELFGDMKLIGRAELSMLEPNLVKGRKGSIRAVVTSGYTMDFQKLSESFIKEGTTKFSEPNAFTGVGVTDILKTKNGYTVKTNKGNIQAKAVAVMAGPQSLMLAKTLGYGTHLGILPVAGSFFYSTIPNLLKGKVYTMQTPKLPFASIHGDPEVHNASLVRFGPTAKVLPLLERYNYNSFVPFLRTSAWTWRGVTSLFKIISDPTLFFYVIKNVFFDLPFVGKYFFTWQARKIVPTLRYSDLKIGKKVGGIRPQVVNTKTMKMEMGEAEIVGDKILFNITPSPGASICLGTAYHSAERLVDFVEAKFFSEQWNTDFETQPVTKDSK